MSFTYDPAAAPNASAADVGAPRREAAAHDFCHGEDPELSYMN
jgi:hypothetical protein